MDARIPVRLAADLLLKRGEISLEEIRALPMVNNKDFMVTNILAARFDAELYEPWRIGVSGRGRDSACCTSDP